MPENRAPYGKKRDPAELGRMTRNMVCLRDAANLEAREAMRAIETAIGRALDGERLLETPNLGTTYEPFYGYRIRSKRGDAALGHDGRPVLVLTDGGKLVMAWKADKGHGWRGATDEDLRGEDLARVLEVLELAIDRHLAKAERRCRRFENIRALADKVTFILGDEQ